MMMRSLWIKMQLHTFPVPEPDELEPGQEPSVPPTTALAAASRPALTLDPETAALYEPAPEENLPPDASAI